MSIIIDGKALATSVQEKLKDEVERLKSQGITPGLAVVLVGEDPASQVYVRNKKKKCVEVGMNSFEHILPASTSEADLLALIRKLNADETVNGILVQLPLPKQINSRIVLDTILPEKDVDGFHPYNVGKMLIGEESFVPCTPLGVMEIIDSVGYDLSGKDAVIIGRSNIVGKPMMVLLMQRNATVTVCHSKTKDIDKKIAAADVVIAAIGKAEFVKGEWIKKGALVIDVGINRTAENRLIGDVEFSTSKDRAAFISPVPGGVGPMTITMLLQNTLTACKRKHHL